MSITLLIRESEGEILSVLLKANSPIVFGRSSSCDIKLSDEKISSRHLLIKFDDQGHILVKDLESTNGTFVNGSQIQETYLMLQDQIMVGKVSIWIDEDSLDIKQRRLLTRSDAPAAAKFINMEGTSTRSPSEDAQRLARLARAEGGHNDLVRERIAKKGAMKGPEVNISNTIAGEESFDLEESTGETKSIKIIKRPKMKKPATGQIKATKKAKKKGLLEMIFSLFKKKS